MKIDRGAKAVFLLAAVVIVVRGIHQAEALLVPFLLAAFIATVTAPLVLWACSKGVPRGIAVLMAVLVDLAAVAGLAAMVGNSVATFYQNLPEYQQSFAATLESSTRWLRSHGVQVSTQWLSKIAGPGDVMSMVAEFLRGVVGVVSNILLVLLIVVFMLFEATGIRQKLVRALVDAETAGRLAKAAREVNKYLLVKTATSAATGILVGVWVALWGVDLPVLWGLLAFLLNYIPTIGSIVAAIPAVTLALLQVSPAAALGVATGYVVINVVIGNFLEPRVLGRTLGMSPLVVFLSVVVWGLLLGPFGALLSVPLTMIIKVFLANTEDLRWVAVMLEPAHRPPRDTVPPLPPEPEIEAGSDEQPSVEGVAGDGATRREQQA